MTPTWHGWPRVCYLHAVAQLMFGMGYIALQCACPELLHSGFDHTGVARHLQGLPVVSSLNHYDVLSLCRVTYVVPFDHLVSY